MEGFFIYCRIDSRDETKYKEKIHFFQGGGWAGPPDNVDSLHKDYYYFTSAGRASEKALGKKNTELIKDSCIKATTPNYKNKTITETLLMGDFYYIDKSCRGYQKVFRDFWGFKDENEKKYTDYFLSNTSLYLCIPLGKPGQLEYNECQCIYYFHLKGEKNTLEKNFYKILCEYTDEELCQKRNICN